ncbi:hypothetical protein OG800_49300 (plasmid) [Streptomyces sp. NBC_00445]|uniref:hypothetical protein n=1 Tax=Streptomyces sp. NBC_00445 TaxID=2975745 RepID=UPI002E208DA7
MAAYEYLSPSEAYYRAVNPSKPKIKGLRGGHAYWVHSDRRGTEETQDNSELYDFSLKTITDVIVSPHRNAYALVYEDGSYSDLCSYDRVCVLWSGGA